MEPNYTWPRLYVKDKTEPGAILTLAPEAAHYLKNVVRARVGDSVRVFNGTAGEYHARLAALDKKEARLDILECLRIQPSGHAPLHLIFPPLKKEAQDFLIEKATELGVDEFHPVLTAQADVRALNTPRVTAQIIGAAEQCERLTLPILHPLIALDKKLGNWPASAPIFVGFERAPEASGPDQIARESVPGPRAILIGPAGGFRTDEKTLLARFPFVRPIWLGENILRAETAGLVLISLIRFMKEV